MNKEKLSNIKEWIQIPKIPEISLHYNKDLDRYEHKKERILNCRFRAKKHYQENKDERKRKIEYLKIEIYSLLGNKCINCGFSDIRALQIDHINGDGRFERKTNRLIYFKNILKSIENNEGRYQLLCANCNWIKRVERGETGYAKY